MDTTETTAKPEVWLEFVDPNTGRKLDVRVSFHSDWAKAGEPREITRSWVNRIAEEILQAIPYTLSDVGWSS